jgi:hypothetical protein
MVRRDASGVRLLTRNGNDWTERFPTIVEAASGAQARRRRRGTESHADLANGICAICSILTRNITTKLAHTYRCTRTRPFRVPSRLSVARLRCQF